MEFITQNDQVNLKRPTTGGTTTVEISDTRLFFLHRSLTQQPTTSHIVIMCVCGRMPTFMARWPEGIFLQKQLCKCGFKITAPSNYHVSQHKKSKCHRQALVSCPAKTPHLVIPYWRIILHASCQTISLLMHAWWTVLYMLEFTYFSKSMRKPALKQCYMYLQAVATCRSKCTAVSDDSVSWWLYVCTCCST